MCHGVSLRRSPHGGRGGSRAPKQSSPGDAISGAVNSIDEVRSGAGPRSRAATTDDADETRARQTAQEVERTAAMLDQKLEGIGLASQPEVVLRLLKMISDPSSQIQDFAKVMRTDHAIAGRVLKLANSAIFAQRTPVTTLERACLVLGLERLKYLAVGFHLSRGAAGGAATAGLERALWGASVLRACMASELARVVAPSSVPESFVVGLMMDAGQPLMLRLLGETYQKMLVEYPEPGRLFLREGESLEFTHVDMIGALARR